MKANELRIGNYYYEGVNILKVKTITHYDGLGSFVNHIDTLDTDIHPIQLTEEWLLKFGFEHSRVGLFGNNYILNGVSIQLKGLGVYMFVHHARCEIQYVHQLQNLYFALTGEELLLNNEITSTNTTNNSSK